MGPVGGKGYGVGPYDRLPTGWGSTKMMPRPETLGNRINELIPRFPPIAIFGEYWIDICVSPSNGSSGGILLLWNSMLWKLLDVYVGFFSVSDLIRDARSKVEWVATSVYGPNM